MNVSAKYTIMDAVHKRFMFLLPDISSVSWFSTQKNAPDFGNTNKEKIEQSKTTLDHEGSWVQTRQELGFFSKFPIDAISITYMYRRFQPTSRDTNNNREMDDLWWTNKRS